MMTKLITHLILIAGVAGISAGCASKPAHFYTLNATAKGHGTPAARYAVAVGPVSVPALVDRPQFTIQVGPNRVVVDEFNRWAAPLHENIARVIVADLAALLGTSQVTTTPMTNFDPAYRVTVHVQRFESIQSGAMQNEAVLIEAIWVVRKTTGGTALSGQTVAREPASGHGAEGLAAAHSRALAKVSADIAAALRAEAGEKP